MRAPRPSWTGQRLHLVEALTGVAGQLAVAREAAGRFIVDGDVDGDGDADLRIRVESVVDLGASAFVL